MDHSTRQNTSAASSTSVVDVLVPVALNQAYSYRVPRGMELKPGDVVCVPLGPREVVAVVWAENAAPDPRLHNRLKDVGEKLDVPPLKEELRHLVDWVSNYTLSARGMVLRMCLRMGENLGPERMRLGVRLVGEPPRRRDALRRGPGEAHADTLARRTKIAHAQGHAQHHAAGAERVVRDPIDELAQLFPQRRIVELEVDVLEAIVQARPHRDVVGPDHAERFARPERNADNIAHFEVELGRRAIRIGMIERNRHQNVHDALRHTADSFSGFNKG